MPTEEKQNNEHQKPGEKRAEQGKPPPFEGKSLQETLEEFAVDPDKGLSGSEAANRLEQHGPNALQEEKENPILHFLSYFRGPIPWMIEAAIAISAVVRHWLDAGVIMFLLLFNGGVTYWHEKSAIDAIKALKEKLALEAWVIRDGEKQKIHAA
jgi:H+-transporting ATPase